VSYLRGNLLRINSNEYMFRTCQGDSGGGLIYSKNNRWYVAGVVSYAIGCGQFAYPTVFTKVPAYIDWIRMITDRA